MAEGTQSPSRLVEHPRVAGLFVIVRKMTDGLYVIATGEHGAMWTLRKLRKDTECMATRAQLHKGEEHYGPVGNMDYRGWRLHKEFVEGAPSRDAGVSSSDAGGDR